MNLKWLFCVLLVCVGCEVDNHDKRDSDSSVITGVLQDVVMCQEDASMVSLLVKFNDGRIKKLRMHYWTPVLFKTGVFNTITFDSHGTIETVEIKEAQNVK